MTLIERIFRLRLVAPFDRLGDADLALIAEAAVLRRYEPGRRIASRGKPARALFVTLEGGLVDGDGARLPDVLPLESLLLGSALSCDVLASAKEGAVCLLFNKGHVFTILHECPALTIGFVEGAREGGFNRRAPGGAT